MAEKRLRRRKPKSPGEWPAAVPVEGMLLERPGVSGARSPESGVNGQGRPPQLVSTAAVSVTRLCSSTRTTLGRWIAASASVIHA